MNNTFMTIYENKEDTFSFEKYICLEKPELWRNEAHNLFSSAQVLFEFATQKEKEIFSDDKKLSSLFSKDISTKAYWHYRIIRMLWGYGFENILKGIILQKFKSDNPQIKEVPIDNIKSHDLNALFIKANIKLEEKELFYIEIIKKCSVWMGRYPMPTKSTEMYEKRESMSSSEELNKRSIDLHEKYIKGEIPRTFCESDVLHSGIGAEEHEIVSDLILRLFNKFSDKTS